MKEVLKGLLIILIVAGPAFIINLVITKEMEKSNYYKKAEKDVMTYLDLRYGDGDFKINDTTYIGGCDILGNCRPDGYEITLTTKYFDKKFKIIILKGNSQIYSDNFINILAKEKWNIKEDIHDYISELSLKKLNNNVPEKYNTKISFNNMKTDENFNFIFYGKLPTIDDLIKSTVFSDPKFEINANLNTETKLLDFLKEFTKFYIEEFPKKQITYSQESKYFRYKFDYSKLGVKDYKDQYNGYGGYVFTDDNNTFRINIMRHVTEYTKEEILR
ncbi:MAG: hypothetical protein ACM3O4_02300 [Ignavibacteriales bacterium]